MIQTRYYAQWMDLLAHLVKYIGKVREHAHSAAVQKWFMSVMGQLDRPVSILKLDQIIQKATIDNPDTYQRDASCSTCTSWIMLWKNTEMNTEIDRMKKLSSFL